MLVDGFPVGGLGVSVATDGVCAWGNGMDFVAVSGVLDFALWISIDISILYAIMCTNFQDL
ncbi:hypothetical protein C8R44DRAFT_990387 [Mycena epipterygia]|nr:hypothetical protein C8R44DRAFT_990387 [Mycena epipterygia]